MKGVSRMNKMLDAILWSMVAITIIIFFALIIIGNATNFRFISTLADDPFVLTNVQSFLSKFS